MQNLTTTTRPATCPLDGPAWCTADHHGEHATQHTHTTRLSEAIETLDPRDGRPSILFADIEQTETGGPHIVLTGTAMDEAYTLDDAERIACQILAQVITARARQAVAA